MSRDYTTRSIWAYGQANWTVFYLLVLLKDIDSHLCQNGTPKNLVFKEDLSCTSTAKFNLQYLTYAGSNNINVSKLNSFLISPSLEIKELDYTREIFSKISQSSTGPTQFATQISCARKPFIQSSGSPTFLQFRAIVPSFSARTRPVLSSS